MTKTNAERDERKPAGSGWWWKRGIVVLLLLLAAFFAYRYAFPGDVSSSIEVTTIDDGDADSTSVGSSEIGSLLSQMTQESIDKADHPFDSLLEIAADSLAKTDAEIQDYTATLISQVRLSGKLQPEKIMFCKIRHPQAEGENKCGFSVYTRFIKPEASKGQEAIWVDGWNEGNLVAHTTGMFNLKRFYLKPDSMLAMRGSRYPITDIGFRNLLAQMVEKGQRDREHGECEVTIKRKLEVGGRECVMLEVKHPIKRDHFEFHIARIYIDSEIEIPLAYEGYLWPEEKGGDPVLLEKYFYTDLKLNVGLEDIDFDPDNESYDYPAN
jgi:hypothetical protein